MAGVPLPIGRHIRLTPIHLTSCSAWMRGRTKIEIGDQPAATGAPAAAVAQARFGGKRHEQRESCSDIAPAIKPREG